MGYRQAALSRGSQQGLGMCPAWVFQSVPRQGGKLQSDPGNLKSPVKDVPKSLDASEP